MQETKSSAVPAGEGTETAPTDQIAYVWLDWRLPAEARNTGRPGDPAGTFAAYGRTGLHGLRRALQEAQLSAGTAR